MLPYDSVAGSVICTLAAVDRVLFVMWSERRCEACSWCVDVHRDARRDPSSADGLGGMEALLGGVPSVAVCSCQKALMLS